MRFRKIRASADRMLMNAGTATVNDDPRKLRSLLERASALASEYKVTSVMVGLASERGDLRFPDFID